MNQNEDFVDRRKTLRVRTFIGAHAVCSDGRRIDCQVRDMSANGAKLSLKSTAGLPENFVLKIPSRGESYPVQIRWREDETLGVEFVSPEAAYRAENEQLRRWAKQAAQRIGERIRGLFARRDELAWA
ncbi:MAG: PilZ domain-containing protein [Beijerinckiaceae bacterium]|nr:PilZ domain-containing protein [Beijerinckiaceae bacterium]